jgi:hypothetical protein
VYCESVHDDEAIEAATRFVHEARFYGAITVAFRRDVRDEGLTLIEVDPRVVRATSLSTALGLDVPAALYDVIHRCRSACHGRLPGAGSVDVARLVPAHRRPESGRRLARSAALGRGPQHATHPRVRVPDVKHPRICALASSNLPPAPCHELMSAGRGNGRIGG